MLNKWSSLGFVLCAALAGPPCLASPASGTQDFTPFLSTQKERQLGATEHPKVLAEFGGVYPDDAKAGYVAQVGGRVVANSELAQEPFTFTLLNSRVLNAFALPGGYVYITRQLLALMNDEAELAAVLGHEIGHVTDRHTAKRYNTQIFGSIGAALAGVLTGSRALSTALGQASQAYTLSFSRNQELKADALGLRYISRAGYDPYATADFLRVLGAQTDWEAQKTGQAADRTPAWQQTHPLTADRVVRAESLAQNSGAIRNRLPRNRDAFLDMLNGLVVDDTAEQGFIDDHSFTHPRLMFTFAVPQGYMLENGDKEVKALGPQGRAFVRLGGDALSAQQSLFEYTQGVWRALAGSSGSELGGVQRTTINGMEAVIGQARLRQSNGAVLDGTIASYRFDGATAYSFVILRPSGRAIDEDVRQIVGSFRKITPAEAARFKERRIEIVTVRSGDTPERLAARMAYKDDPLGRLRILNGLSPQSTLIPGQKLKLITWGR